MSDITPENVPTNTAPYPQFGESPNMTTPPLPVPGYPTSDVPPNATGGTVFQQVPNVHGVLGEALEKEYDRDIQLQRLERQNAELLARLNRLEEKPAVPAAPVALVGGGEPVAHHLWLVDGRVIQDHGGIGTHYSETLPDGSTRVTRVKEYFPADEPDPVASLA